MSSGGDEGRPLAYGRRVKRIALALPLLALAGCPPASDAIPPRPTPVPTSSAATDEPVPSLRLPADTRPLTESVELKLDPRQERYTGSVEIDVELAEPRGVLWLHGKDLHVGEASVTPAGGSAIAATWAERHESGVVALTLATAAPAGKARVHVAFDAPLATGQKGLYKTSEAGADYIFTQFEAIAARSAFPCFDDPGFKIPYALTLVVPADQHAVANTRELAHTVEGDWQRLTFAPTLPLPSYLVALAVGPLDIVAAPDVPPNDVRERALPLRAITAKGRGKDVAYALAHTGEILATLEGYTRIAYPYDKLDIIAIPGKRGAMENPGAVTFGEFLLLFEGSTAPIAQRRAYASVMAHELAHMWVGDLVTMQWWDDLWLNEAFATWLGNKAADLWDPRLQARLSLLRSIQGAMGTDGLVSARSIRQPIESTHDIENAFDSITYQKGGGVLSMFERWAGPDAWQRGFTAYLQKHSHGNATADDFLDAENAATGKDVKRAFHTFLDQPGVPFVEVSLACPAGAAPTVHLAQSRFLPLGSSGDAKRTWQIPVCIRYGQGDEKTECVLLGEPEADFQLLGAGGCPSWIFPNADGAGYYRFALAPNDLANLRKNGMAALSIREKVAYANSLRAGYARGTTSFGEALDAQVPLASELDPAVAEEPMGLVAQARDWFYGDPLRAETERFARSVYAPAAKRLGWDGKGDESDELRALRTSVLSFLAHTGQDPVVRAEARRRGLAYVKGGVIHPEAVDPNLASLALSVVGEEADRATWDALRELFAKSVDEAERGRLLWAVCQAKAPELVAATLELVLDPTLRDSEVLSPLWARLTREETQDQAWQWLRDHYDAVVARLPKHHGGAALVSTGQVFCDEAHAAEMEAFFGPKIEGIEGGPRTLATTLEGVRLCAKRRALQEPQARAHFGKR